MRQARARIIARPPALSSASTSSTARPGRMTPLLTRTSPVGTGPRMSTLIRPMMAGPSMVDGSRSMARVSRADGGPAC